MSNFLTAARHTDKASPLPHQDAAWTYAWDCLSQEERTEFLSIFRAAVPAKTDDVPASWVGITTAAAQAGARYPELVAAQAALESGWFKKASGRNNFWGIKGKGTTKPTWEVVNGKEVDVDAEFMDFDSTRAGVQYLVRLWYQDYVAPDGKTYQGVNRAPDREAAAEMLVAQGYATDPAYARKLCDLMGKHAPRPKPTQELLKAESKVWQTKVKALNLSQPDASTCQAACIGMAVGNRDILGIRQQLSKRGVAGDPANMAAIIRTYSNVDYVYEGNASLAKVESWLKEGELLITHGWFTRSGHVIVLDGVMTKPNGSVSYDVKDPWGEFDGASWKYLPKIKFFDGFYSRQLIYATCVAGSSVTNAEYVYRNSSVDVNRAGMWVHRFRV